MLATLQASFQKGTIVGGGVPGGSPPQSSLSDAGSVTGVTTFNIADDRLKMAVDRFYECSKGLKELDASVITHYKNLVKTFHSRTQLLESLDNMAQGTPLEEIVKARNAACYSTALEVQQVETLLEKFQREVVEYVGEWEKTVSSRVGAELKHLQGLNQSYERYRLKVDGLHNSLENAKKKARTRPQTISQLEEKLVWNESKLRNAKREYRRNLIAVTLLTEEVTDRAWKELVPLLLRLMDLDVKSSQTASEMAGTVTNLRNEMVQLAKANEMDYESLHKGRLRILREEDAMDFVNPQQLQELEASIDQSTIFLEDNNVNAGLSLPSTPAGIGTQERLQEIIPKTKEEIAGSHDRLNVEVTLQEPHDDDGEEKKFDLEDQSLDTSGFLKYPRYIDVTVGGADCKMDDETTLTGTPDMVSV